MTLSLPVIDRNERPDLCVPCGGLCCKRSPGFTLPGDWANAAGELDEERLEEALVSGEWVLERWHDDLVPRPATANEVGDVVADLTPDSWLSGHFYSGAGRCNLLGENGCTLPFEKRPAQCRMSVPSADHHCMPPQGIGYRKDSEFQNAWEPYTEALERISSRAWKRA